MVNERLTQAVSATISTETHTELSGPEPFDMTNQTGDINTRARRIAKRLLGEYVNYTAIENEDSHTANPEARITNKQFLEL